MNRLLGIAIYYMVFGICAFFSVFTFELWRLGVLGFSVLIVYVILKYFVEIDQLPFISYRSYGKWLTIIMAIFPFLCILTIHFYTKPQKQTIILPKDYQGEVSILYSKFSDENSISFSDRKTIRVGESGMVKTLYSCCNNDIPFLNIESKSSLEETNIFFENDLINKIPVYNYNKPKNKSDIIYNFYKTYEFPVCYSAILSNCCTLFIIIPPSKYSDYFNKKADKNGYFLKSYFIKQHQNHCKNK